MADFNQDVDAGDFCPCDGQGGFGGQGGELQNVGGFGGQGGTAAACYLDAGALGLGGSGTATQEAVPMGFLETESGFLPAGFMAVALVVALAIGVLLSRTLNSEKA